MDISNFLHSALLRTKRSMSAILGQLMRSATGGGCPERQLRALSSELLQADMRSLGPAVDSPLKTTGRSDQLHMQYSSTPKNESLLGKGNAKRGSLLPAHWLNTFLIYIFLLQGPHQTDGTRGLSRRENDTLYSLCRVLEQQYVQGRSLNIQLCALVFPHRVNPTLTPRVPPFPFIPPFKQRPFSSP